LNNFLIKILIPVFITSYHCYSFESASKSESDDYLLLSNIQQYNEAQQRDQLAEKITQEVGRQIKKASAQSNEDRTPVSTKKSIPSKNFEPKKTIKESTQKDTVCINPQEFLNKIFDDKELDIHITLKTKPYETQEVLGLLGKTAKLDLVVDEEVKGKCGNLSFNDTSVGNILKYICTHNQPQLCLIKDMNIWRVLLRSKAEEYFQKIQQNTKQPHADTQISNNKNIKKKKYQQHAIDVKNAQLTKEFKEHAEKAWSTIVGKDPNSMFTIDEETKKILMRGKNSHIKEFKNFLTNVDLNQLKVKVDLAILIVNKEYGLDLGINWSGIYNRQNTIIDQKKQFGFIGLGGTLTDFPTPTQSTVPNNSKLLVNPENLAINIFNNTFTDILTTFVKLPFVFGGPDLNLRRLNLLLNASERQNNSKLMSKPTMLITNNQVGKLLIGESLPIYTTVQDVVQSSVRSLSTINYKDVGISIQIKPTISQDKRSVNINIFLELSEVISGGTSTNPQGINENPPVILLLKHKNNILLENGQTAIIGGLLQDDETEIIQEIPYLSKLPLIGKLFKAKLNQKVELERFIFITPTIIE
jgi:Flp pilus assembly secretin CpaC